MPTIQNRRRFLAALSSVGASGLMGNQHADAQGGPPETTTVRLAKIDGTCIAPQYVAVRSRWSLANTVIVIAGELTLGVLHGIALGVVLSLLLLIYQTSHPRGSELGQLPESEAYRNVKRHPE